MTLRWTRSWLKHLKINRTWPARRAAKPHAPLRLHVEGLEDRTMPSVLIVSNTKDSGSGSLRHEVQAAHDGDTIKFSSALYGKAIILSSGKEILISTNISILGPGSGHLTIEGHGSRLFEIGSGATVALDGLALEYGRAAGQGGAILDHGNLTLKNDVLKYDIAKGSAGAAAQGGGVYVDSAASLTLDNDVLRLDNAQGGASSAGQGGALFFASGSSGTLAKDTIKSNIASGYASLAAQGGGLWAQGANLSINLSTISGNTATGNASGIGLPGAAQGGGLYLDGGTVAITQSTVSGNLASGTPGGSGAPGVTGTPGGAGGIAQGGGLFASDSTTANITLTADTFANNIAFGGDGGWGGTGTKLGGSGGLGGDGAGGAIAVHDAGGSLTIELTNDTFASNVAKGGVGGTGGTGPRGQGGPGGAGGNGQGGALWADGGAVTLVNDTIAGSSPSIAHTQTIGNKAIGQSGGYASAGAGVLGPGGTGQGGGLFTTGNAAMTVINTIVANNIASTADPDVAGTFTGGDHNLIGDPTGSTGFGGSDLTGVDPHLAALASYGGPTQTMLLIGGPAVDAADDSAAPAADQRGITRPQGAHADIGAVEDVNLTFALAAGNNQTARRGRNFSSLVVKLTENGKPVAGVIVTFTVIPDSGTGASGKLNHNQSTTNASGRAAVVVTANSKAGPFTVTAQIDGLPALTFHLTNR